MRLWGQTPRPGHIRQPAVAGRFYPGAPEQLADEIDTYLAQARAELAVRADLLPPGSGRAANPSSRSASASSPEAARPADGQLVGLVAPHAGTVYSGPTAGFAYAMIDPDVVDRVVMLGPAHHVPVEGIGFSTAAAWLTPLGEVELDAELAADLAAHISSVGPADAAHAPEHSLEVQLPFLQRVLLDGWRLVPLLVGADLPHDAAAVITMCAALPRTLVVVSTDLSHYLDYEAALARDSRTIRAIGQRRAAAIGTLDACGRHPLRGLLTAADAEGWTVRLLDARNSGDTAGTRERVVGYAAFSVTSTGHRPRVAAGVDPELEPQVAAPGISPGIGLGASTPSSALGSASSARPPEDGDPGPGPAGTGRYLSAEEPATGPAGFARSLSGGSAPGMAGGRYQAAQEPGIGPAGVARSFSGDSAPGPTGGRYQAAQEPATGPAGVAARSLSAGSAPGPAGAGSSTAAVGRITAESQAALLALARRTIEDTLGSGRRPPFDLFDLGPADPILRAPGAAFVTLRSGDGALLGCIGSLTARQALAADVAEHAFDAAFRDPRFPPMTASRARDMVVDISVLSAPAPFPCASYDDLMARVPFGRGLVVRSGRHRATFLPAVWQQLPDPRTFLAGLWRKAGLVVGDWPPDVTIEVYDSDEFAERQDPRPR